MRQRAFIAFALLVAWITFTLIGCDGPTLERDDPPGIHLKSRRLPELDPRRREYVAT